MDGRPTHLVTGANRGIGFAVARALTTTGARVVIACRSAERADQARAALDREAPVPVEVMLVDLASQQSTRRAVASFAETHPRLDVLVNCAGDLRTTREETEEGRELMFATNVLGYHLLTMLLLPLLERAPSGRVVNVASMMAYGLDLDDLEWRRRPFHAPDAYAQCKQANRMLTWALARRLAGSRVTANAVNPGAVATRFLPVIAPGVVGRSPEEGADTITWLATSAAVAGVSSRFWSDRQQVPCNVRDEAAEEALWARCGQMTGLSPDGDKAAG